MIRVIGLLRTLLGALPCSFRFNQSIARFWNSSVLFCLCVGTVNSLISISLLLHCQPTGGVHHNCALVMYTCSTGCDELTGHDAEVSQTCRKQEILLYILPLAAFDFVYPRRQLPEQPPSFARLVAEVFLSLFFYDLFFTVIHYASHQVRAARCCSFPVLLLHECTCGAGPLDGRPAEVVSVPVVQLEHNCCDCVCIYVSMS
jgi:hypothetical protein